MDGQNDDILDLFDGKPIQQPKLSKKQDLLSKMLGSISTQESNGKKSIVNPDSGAMGEFQVMPFNVPNWTKKHLKRQMTAEQFKADPDAQRRVFEGEMGEYLDGALKRAKSDEEAVRMAAVRWYGGNYDDYDDPTPQYSNGKKYPSRREYTTKVASRIFGNKSKPEFLDLFGDANSTPGVKSLDLFSDNKSAEPIDLFNDNSPSVQPVSDIPKGFGLEPDPNYMKQFEKSQTPSPTAPTTQTVKTPTEQPELPTRQRIVGNNLPVNPLYNIENDNSPESYFRDTKGDVVREPKFDIDVSAKLNVPKLNQPQKNIRQNRNVNQLPSAPTLNLPENPQNIKPQFPSVLSNSNNYQQTRGADINKTIEGNLRTSKVYKEKPTADQVAIDAARYVYGDDIDKVNEIFRQTKGQNLIQPLPTIQADIDQYWNPQTGVYDNVGGNINSYVKSLIETYKSQGADAVINQIKRNSVNPNLTAEPTDTQIGENLSKEINGTDEELRQKISENLNKEKQQRNNPTISDAFWNAVSDAVNPLTSGLPNAWQRVYDNFTGQKDSPVSESEINTEFERQKKNQLSPESLAKSKRAADYLNDTIGGGVYAGMLGGAGRTFSALAGVARPFASLGFDSAYNQLSKMGKELSTTEQLQGDNGFGNQAVKMLGGVGFDLTRLGLLSRLPGGAMIGFSADSILQSAGRGDKLKEIQKEGTKGAFMGGLMPLGEYAGQVTGSPLARLGTIALGTTGIELAFGSPIPHAVQSSVLNLLFDAVTHHGSQMFGKSGRIWKDGKPIDVSIKENGEVDLTQNVKQDFEIVSDPQNKVYDAPPPTVQEQVNQQQKPGYYFTAQKTVPLDPKNLSSPANTVAVDISKKPSGMNLGEFLLRQALKANQEKYGFSDEAIEQIIAENKSSAGQSTKIKYPDLTDEQFQTALLDFQRKNNGSTYINYSLSKKTLNKLLGGDENNIAKPLLEEQTENLPRLSEADAQAKTENDLLEAGIPAEEIRPVLNQIRQKFGSFADYQEIHGNSPIAKYQPEFPHQLSPISFENANEKTNIQKPQPPVESPEMVSPAVAESKSSEIIQPKPTVSDSSVSNQISNQSALENSLPETSTSNISAEPKITVSSNGKTVEVTKNPQLSEKAKTIQDEAINDLQNDTERFVNLYEEQFGNVVNADNAKELFKQYREDRLGNERAVHPAASALAKLVFQEKLAEVPDDGLVLLTAGGQGSGKSSVIKETDADLVYDSVMGSKEGNRQMIDLIADSGKQGQIVFVFRPIENAVVGMMRRSQREGRIVSENNIAKGHFNALDNFLNDTAPYAAEKGFLVKAVKTVENGNPQEISLEELNDLRYNSIDEVKQRAEESFKTEYEQSDYSPEIEREFFNRTGQSGKGNETDFESQNNSRSTTTEEKTQNTPPLSESESGERLSAGSETSEIKGKSKVGQSIEAKTIEKGLASSFDETAGYDKITVKEQAQKAADLINSSPEKAKNIVLGKESLPDGLRGATIIKAMEDYALETGDVQLLKDIANSPLTAETSIHAQEMRMLAERNPDSPVVKIQEINKARERSFQKQNGKGTSAKEAVRNEVKEIKNKIRDLNIDKRKWKSFIDDIMCK